MNRTTMNRSKDRSKDRSRLVALAVFVLLAVPAALVVLGLLPHPSTGLVAIGDWLYVAAGTVAVGLLVWRWRRLDKRKPLPGILTQQGLAIILVGISGLLALAVFAPRFPETARDAYLGGVGIIILFTMIPLGLLAYVRRKLP